MNLKFIHFVGNRAFSASEFKGEFQWNFEIKAKKVLALLSC
jgi:hypothetical protein